MMPSKTLTLMVQAVGLSTLIAWCLPAPAVAQQITSLKLTSSHDSIHIAEPFEVEIVATAEAGAKLLFPVIGQQLGEFDVIDHEDRFDVPIAKNSSQRRWIRRLTLETITTGTLVIPPIEVVVVWADSTRERLTTESYPIQVASVLENDVDATKFNDIRNVVDIEEEKPASYRWLGWVGGGVVGIAGLLGLSLIVARRKRWMTPTRWALQQLEAHTPVTLPKIEQVLRIFIQREFEFPASSFSIDQIHSELVCQDVPREACERVCAVLRKAEQAKFAGLRLSEPQLAATIDDASSVVRELAREDG